MGELCEKCDLYRPTPINLGFGFSVTYGDPDKMICGIQQRWFWCKHGTKLYWSWKHGWMNPDGTINERYKEHCRTRQEDMLGYVIKKE